MPKKNILGWEEVLQDQPESYQLWFKKEKEFLINNIKSNSKVLEVGCGEGRSLRDISEVTQNLVGIDHDETAIEHAKEKLKDLKECKVLLANGLNLPFKDKKFDYVTCIGTFANLGENKYNILKEMSRVLKDSGKIIISVYSENALEERLKVYKKIAGTQIKEIKENGTVLFDDFDKSDNSSEQFSKEQLKEIFDKVNLKIDKIEDAGIAYLCLLSKKV